MVTVVFTAGTWGQGEGGGEGEGGGDGSQGTTGGVDRILSTRLIISLIDIDG